MVRELIFTSYTEKKVTGLTLKDQGQIANAVKLLVLLCLLTRSI